MVKNVYITPGFFSEKLGKTAFCVGLSKVLQEKGFKKVGYFKPIGRPMETVEGKFIDADATLLKSVLGMDDVDYSDIVPFSPKVSFIEQFRKQNKEYVIY